MNNCAGCLVLVSFVVSPVAWGQEVAEPGLEEIVVTAQRREQNLQDVPISITAFSKEQIQKNGISEAKDYFLFTPNVNFTEDGEAGERSVGISIRGVSDLASALTDIGGMSNSFGIYLDEFNIANSANKVSNPQLLDLESIEILRGPQGTYFGRNATGGAINLTTTLPNDEPYYELGAGYGSFATWNVSMIGNFPLTENLFVRGVAWHEESDGFIENLSTTGNDASYEHNNVRAAARWLLNDRFTADFSVMRTRENDGTDTNVNSGVLDVNTVGAIPSLLPVNPVNGSALEPHSTEADFRDRPHAPTAGLVPVDSGRGFFPNNRRYINKDFYESNVGTSTILNSRLNYVGDGWSLRSITGYLDSEAQRRSDQDLTQYGLYETHSGRISTTFSQEVRFHLDHDVWDVTFGGIYADDSTLVFSVSPVGPDGFAFGTLNPDGTIATCGFCLSPGELIAGKSALTFDSTSFAIFGDVTRSINDDFAVTGGVRYTRDDLSFKDFGGFSAVTFRDVQGGTTPPDSDLAASDERSFSNLSPRVVVTYSPTDSLNTYVVASAGYKPGGTLLDNNTRYEEERLWNYEAGVKLEGFNRRLAVNAAVFYMDWSDMQIPSLEVALVGDEVDLRYEIFNVDAKSQGFELEIQALPTEHLFLGGGVGYLKAEIGGYGDDDPYIFEGMAFNLNGETLPRAPEWTVNLVGQYNSKFMNLDSFYRIEWSYRDETFSDVEAVAAVLEPLDIPGFNDGVSGVGLIVSFPRDDFPFRVPAFDVLNLRAGIEGERWSLVAYAENVLDDNYYTGTQENFGLGGIRIRPHHRIVGINVRFSSE